MMKKQKVMTMLLTALLMTVVSFSAEAKKKKRSGKKAAKITRKADKTCKADIATSTMYFVPHIKDYCSTPTPCKKFKKEVRMQGSGTLAGNKLLTYKGKIRSLGSCETAFGAAGVCLTPFISVAADARYYSMGDVIEMPSMKGKEITMPDGTTMIHPGYFIVQDTGGAIKGKNRFDFFTGSYGLKAKKNAFGVNGFDDPQMATKNQCSSEKQFSVVRRGSLHYEQSLASIEDAIHDGASSQRVAGLTKSEGGQ